MCACDERAELCPRHAQQERDHEAEEAREYEAGRAYWKGEPDFEAVP
jgi:hypothetical protein